MKNSKDTVGNRTRNLAAFRAIRYINTNICNAFRWGWPHHVFITNFHTLMCVCWFRCLISMRRLSSPPTPRPSALNCLRTNVHIIMQLDNVNFKIKIWKHFQISVKIKQKKKKERETFQTKFYICCYPRPESIFFRVCRFDKYFRKDLSTCERHVLCRTYLFRTFNGSQGR